MDFGRAERVGHAERGGVGRAVRWLGVPGRVSDVPLGVAGVVSGVIALRDGKMGCFWGDVGCLWLYVVMAAYE